MNNLVIRLISLVFDIFSFMILVDVIGSWVLAARVQLPSWVYDILQTVRAITSPVLDPIRRVMPRLGGLDLSPIIALLLLDLLRRLLLTALYNLG